MCEVVDGLNLWDGGVTLVRPESGCGGLSLEDTVRSFPLTKPPAGTVKEELLLTTVVISSRIIEAVHLKALTAVTGSLRMVCGGGCTTQVAADVPLYVLQLIAPCNTYLHIHVYINMGAVVNCKVSCSSANLVVNQLFTSVSQEWYY